MARKWDSVSWAGVFWVQKSEYLAVFLTCELTSSPVCLSYRNGDFISTSKKYHIPAEGSSLLFIFTNLVTSLMTLLYLLAAFHLVVAFLHFFLFFGTSVPFDHLYTTDPLPPLTGFTAASRPIVRRGGVTSRQILQKEVDMRIRCERDPYEAYYWVWWAWWAHRRSGLGELFALIVGLMGIGTVRPCLKMCLLEIMLTDS